MRPHHLTYPLLPEASPTLAIDQYLLKTSPILVEAPVGSLAVKGARLMVAASSSASRLPQYRPKMKEKRRE